MTKMKTTARSSEIISFLFFLILLYVAGFVLYYALVFAFYFLIVGPGMLFAEPACVPHLADGVPIGNHGADTSLCQSVAALRAKFTSPWFYGGLVVTIGALAAFPAVRASRRRNADTSVD
jgi:hypothetical protein